MIETGARPSEIVNLREHTIHLDAPSLRSDAVSASAESDKGQARQRYHLFGLAEVGFGS
jgi:hypothetical protein